MHVHRRVDVVTVGAGWTSNILGWKLGTAGHRVVALEQGPERWAAPDFAHNHDSLRYAVRKAMMHDLTHETWTWRPNTRMPSLPMRKYGAFHPGQGLGGSAVHWSAMLWRFKPYDFQYRSFYVDRYGEGILPEGSSVQDWPVSYEELEPYFTAFDYDIGASGQTGNLNGRILDGGNPFEAPRSKPFPLPPLARTIPSEIFADAARRLGYHPFPQPSGILSQAYQDPFGNYRAGCLYCGFCTRFGCEVDAKSAGLTTHLPVALKTGRYEVRTHSKVLRVNLAQNGLATGVTYIDLRTGEEHEQPAEVVVLSGYTLSNVRMLLLSRGGPHPSGIGNDRGMVGRNLTHQMWSSPVTGVFEGRRFNLFMGNTSTINVIHDFYGDRIDHGPLGFIGGSSIFSTPGERDPVSSAGELPIGASNGEETVGMGQPPGGGADRKSWGRDWKEALRRHWDSFVPITIQGESPAYSFHFMDLDPNYTDAHGMPLLRLTLDWTDNERGLYRFIAQKCQAIMQAMGPTFMSVTPELPDYDIADYKSTHINGGAIMGADPGHSVTNKYGQVWDTPNVFVTGAALYPQNPAANPTGTLAALAYFAGDALAQRYFENPGELLV